MNGRSLLICHARASATLPDEFFCRLRRTAGQESESVTLGTKKIGDPQKVSDFLFHISVKFKKDGWMESGHYNRHAFHDVPLKSFRIDLHKIDTRQFLICDQLIEGVHADRTLPNGLSGPENLRMLILTKTGSGRIVTFGHHDQRSTFI